MKEYNRTKLNIVERIESTFALKDTSILKILDALLVTDQFTVFTSSALTLKH